MAKKDNMLTSANLNSTIMRSLKSLILILLTATLIYSCSNRNILFDESTIITNASWNSEDMPYFNVTIDDTLSNYTFYLNIRHLENYRYSNIYLFLHSTFPNGNQTHDTIECMLAYPDGRWVGKGSGSMRASKILLNNNLRFPISGEYRFEIEQAMRETPLQGITDIGLCFEKSDN